MTKKQKDFLQTIKAQTTFCTKSTQLHKKIKINSTDKNNLIDNSKPHK